MGSGGLSKFVCVQAKLAKEHKTLKWMVTRGPIEAIAIPLRCVGLMRSLSLIVGGYSQRSDGQISLVGSEVPTIGLCTTFYFIIVVGSYHHFRPLD